MNCYKPLSDKELKFRYQMKSLPFPTDELIGILFDRLLNPEYDTENIKSLIEDIDSFESEVTQFRYSLRRIKNHLKEMINIESKN